MFRLSNVEAFIIQSNRNRNRVVESGWAGQRGKGGGWGDGDPQEPYERTREGEGMGERGERGDEGWRSTMRFTAQ